MDSYRFYWVYWYDCRCEISFDVKFIFQKYIQTKKQPVLGCFLKLSKNVRLIHLW